MPAKKANILFGPVNIPVRVEPTTSAAGSITFKTLHKECLTPVKAPKLCPKCEVDVGPDNSVRGFEVSKGNFVVIRDEEYALAKTERTPLIQIEKFIDEEQESDLMVESTYWLVAEEMPAFRSSYTTFAQALAGSSLVGFGYCALWGKERPCLLREQHGRLLMQRLYVASELRAAPEVPSEPAADEAVRMAALLIDMMVKPLTEDDLTVSGAELLASLIESKVGGATFTVPEEEAAPAPTIDLMAALKASLPKRKEAKESKKAKVKAA